VALVTGFSKGLGWAMAQALAGAASSAAFNVTDKSAVRLAVESIDRQFGRSQQLGIVSRNLLHDLTDRDWNSVVGRPHRQLYSLPGCSA